MDRWHCGSTALGAVGTQDRQVPHQLLRGWQPQKEMFFIWKKWLQRWNWSRSKRGPGLANAMCP